MAQLHAGDDSRSQTGQMTAVMRALPQASGRKVLRIGVVQVGRVLEERVIKQRTHVTIGTDETCIFVLSLPEVPSSFRLFELVGTDYYLNFLDGMTGRVALPTGVSELEGLRGQATRTGQAYQVHLTDDARGKVIVGDTTLLFQFVAPPPVQAKPQLPASIQSGMVSQIDWSFTVIASFSFLFHFGAVGMMYADWMDEKVEDSVSIVGLLDTVKSLQVAQVVEQPEVAVRGNTITDQGPGVPDKTSKPGGRVSTGEPSQKAGSKEGLSPSERAALASELDEMGMATLGALNNTRSATDSVLRDGQVPTGALEDAAGKDVVVGNHGSGLNIPGSSTIHRDIRDGHGLEDIGNVNGAAPATASSASRVAVVPKSSVSTTPAVSVGKVNNPQRTVSGLSGGFRNCYNRGLLANSEMSGAVMVTAKIGSNGEVMSATGTTSGSVSGEVSACVVSVVKRAQFDPPEGGVAVLQIPVKMITQR